MSTRKQRDNLLQRFTTRYTLGESSAMDIVELQAIGANVGANGYTTLDQAEQLITVLELTPDSRLLDIGSGRGWPGLYIAKHTGCSVVLSDVPGPAVQVAAKRARAQAHSARISIVRAAAAHLPFAARSFDAVSHTDTL